MNMLSNANLRDLTYQSVEIQLINASETRINIDNVVSVEFCGDETSLGNKMK